MKFPPALRRGDTIAIISTARKVKEHGLNPAIETLESWGLNVVCSPLMYAEDNQFAGNDEVRRDNLQRMMDDPTLKAILCARGGYGTLRIIDQVGFEGMNRHPKWLVGFSDVTVLLGELYNKQVASVHGPMAVSWTTGTADEPSKEYLRQILMEDGPITYKWPCDHEHLTKTGRAEGRLIGGNLSILSQMIGTSSDFNADGAILFIEDIDEYLYHIDRMMLHLKRSGKLQKLAGIVIGAMELMKDNTTPFGKTAEEIVFEHVKDYDYPVAFDFRGGHMLENWPLIIGATVEMRVSHSECQLEMRRT